MAGMVAAVPVAERSTSQLVHIYLPGYRPGRTPRSPDSRGFQHAMCNIVTVNERMPETNRVMPGEPLKHEHHTLSEARRMIAAGGYLRWCPLCITRATVEENLLGTMVGLIIDRQVRLHGE